MADEFESIIENQDENNINTPNFTPENLQKKTIYELKEILRQSGQKISGKKTDLIARICGLLVTNTSDTRSITKTAEAQFLDLSAPNINKNHDLSYDDIVKDVKNNNSWQKDFRNLPSFDFVRLYDYLVVQTNKYDHAALNTSGYKKLKAFQFFCEGHIKDLQLAEIGGLIYIKGEVLASMKQAKYLVAIVFSSNGEVLKAACKCPAG